VPDDNPARARRRRAMRLFGQARGAAAASAADGRLALCLEERGRLFIGPQAPVYRGMIIGEHSRENDLEVNPLKGKKLTNIRAAGSDEAVRLTPPVIMSLEQAIAWIDDDELVEVTPTAIRLRKRLLDPHERKRQARAAG
jgi:GTP-binding protein